MREDVKRDIDTLKSSKEWESMSDRERKASVAFLIGFTEEHTEARSDVSTIERWSR